MLKDPDWVDLERIQLPFAEDVSIAHAKLRTQQSRWPRSPDKRLVDRADLIRLLRDNPGLYECLRERAEPALHDLLEEVRHESQLTDELPPYPDDDDADPPLK